MGTEPLKWLLQLDAELGGATAFAKKLVEVESKLGRADVATSKTEQKLASTGQAAAKMATDVARASAQYVESLMQMGVPLDRVERLGKVLQRGLGPGVAAKPNDELRTLRANLDALKKPGEIEKLKHEIANFGHATKEAGHHTHEAAAAGGEFRNVMRDATKIVGFHELSRAIDETKHSYVGMAEFAVGVLAFEGIKTAIELVTELGGEIMKAAAQEERMGKVFELNLGVRGGQEAQEYAEKYAKNTEFSKEQTEAFATELLKAGVPLEKLDMYMAAAGDVAAKSKNPIEGMAAAVAAFSRSSLTGKIGGRTVLGLGIGLPYMKELQEFRGKSDEELKSILEDGELTTNQVMRMIAGRDGMVGDHAVEMGKTMAATLTHIGELPDRYFEKFASSPSFEVFKGKLGEILDSLDPNKQPGSSIFTSLEGAVTGIVDVVAKIDFNHVAEVIRDDVVPAIGEMVAAIGPMLERIEQTINGMRIAARFFAHPIETATEIATTGSVDLKKSHQVTMREVRDAAGLQTLDVNERNKLTDATSYDPLAASLAKNVARDSNIFGFGPARPEERAAKAAEEERKAGRGDEYQSIPPAQPAVDDIAQRSSVAVDKFQSRFEAAGIHAATGYVSGIRSGTEDATRAGGELAEGALGGNAKAQESHSPSRKFARLGGYAAEGYVEGIDDGAEAAARAGKGLGVAALDGLPDGRAPGARFADASLAVPLFSPAAAAAPEVRAEPPAPVERKIEINVTVPINMPAGARAREVDDMIAKLRGMLPGTLQAAVEALAIEGGV